MKKIVYVLIGLVLIYLVLCLTGPGKIDVSRSIAINAPAEAIKTAFLDYKFFKEKWSPWTRKDPNMESVFEGEMGKPGSKYTWKGNDSVGAGSMEIVSVGKDTIHQRIIFTAPRETHGHIYFITKAEGNSTLVTWGMKFKIGFMMRGMMRFMNMEKHVAPDFERGLANLKKVMEETPVTKTYQGYQVNELSWDEKTFFGKKSTVSFDKLSAFFAENFPKIGQELVKNKIEPAGHPSCIFYSYDEKNQKTECAAVFPVANGTEVKGWEKFIIAPSKVLQIAYYGPYNENMKKPHMAMDEFIKEKGLTHTSVIEEYVTDPMSEKDSTKWLTNIYYIIK